MGTTAMVANSTIRLSPGWNAVFYWGVWAISIIGIGIILWAALKSKRWARWTTQDILIVAALGVLLEVYDNIIGDQLIGPLINPIRVPPSAPFWSGLAELAVPDGVGELAPLVWGEQQGGPGGVLAVPKRDRSAAGFGATRDDRELHAGTAVPAAEGRLAPHCAGQVHLSIAFLARSMEACRGSASAFSMSYSNATRATSSARSTTCPASGLSR